MDAPDTLTVPGTPDGVREALATLESWGVLLAVSPDTRHRVLTALDEVLSNVVRHGFKRQAGEMTIMRSCRGGSLSVEVADTAPAFNPLLVAPPDVGQALESRRPGGLGIALVRALSDDLQYAHRLGRNVLTLSWRLDGPVSRR
jgi:serine/threonine-protein kinase RsbW